MPYQIIKGGGVFAVSSPWRQHHTRYGKPKQIHPSREAAEQKALDQTADLGTEFSAYTCDLCGEYHIGGTRRYIHIWQRQLQDMDLELGERVVAHMKQEAVRPYGAIRQRCLTAIRHRLR